MSTTAERPIASPMGSLTIFDRAGVPAVDVDVSQATSDATQLRGLAAALVRAAAELEAGPGFPTHTVLDEDLGLQVHASGDAVILSYDPAEDGDWLFMPDGARALAYALLVHAEEASRRPI